MEISIRWAGEGYLINVADDTANFPQGPAPHDYHYKGRDKKKLAAIAREAYRYHASKPVPRGTVVLVHTRAD